MSPRFSDYRNEEFNFEENQDFSYSREFDSGAGRSTPRPTNRPARRSGKPKTSHNGMQRRRNKHWNW